MTFSGRTTRLLSGALALGLVALFPLAPAQARSSTKHLTFTVSFTSQGTTLHDLPGGVVYGWNNLTGPTTWGKKKATVEFLGSVDYVDGSGDFGGLITVTRSDGTTLAFSATGDAMSPPGTGTEDTHFAGALSVIGGTGAYKGASGIGTMSGFRKSALGSPVTLTFDLRVRQ